MGGKGLEDNSEYEEDETSLSQDIQLMLHNEAFHDMVFVCGEQEEEIGASRVLVASRSPMLQSLLLSSCMMENTLTRIHLPKIDVCTMHICVEFLYTDNVQDSSWKSVLYAMKVVEAAMFFLLIRLERLAIKYMHKTIFRKEFEDEEWVLGIVSAYNLGMQLLPFHLSKKDEGMTNMSALLDKFRFFVHNRAGCNTRMLFSQSHHEALIYRNLSDLAFAHVLENKYASEQPLAEYFNFLHLVRWTTLRFVQSDTSMDENEVKETLNRCFPRSLDILSSSILLDADDKPAKKTMKLLSGWLLLTIRRFPLNFESIPADILCRFIEPLCIIPEAVVMSAYRAQALGKYKLRWDPLGHGRRYIIQNSDCSVISYTGKTFKSFARCNTYLSTTKDTFVEWEIAIQTRCEKMRIGFYIQRLGMPSSAKEVLGDEVGSWALGSDGKLYSATFGSGAPESVEYSDPFDAREEVLVRVHLDMANHTCLFTIDGVEAGEAWNNLPFGKHCIYPAVSLSKNGKVQVRSVTGSWMENPNKRLCTSSPGDIHKTTMTGL